MSEEFSTAKDLSGRAEVDVTEKQVVKYLQNNPKFFARHHELLSRIKLPHESGKAISLIEKQVHILREQEVEATKKLKDLLKNAKNNDEIFAITKSLILALLNAKSLKEISASIKEQFASLTNIDACEIIFVSCPNLSMSDTVRIETLDTVMEKYSDALRLKKTYCGKLGTAQIRHLFQTTGKSVASTALCPVINNGEPVALLALGNETENYFNIHLDTLFLDFICQVVGSRIFSLLRSNEENTLA